MNTSPPLPADLREAFRHVYDPEFGVSIEDLGLIYDISIAADGCCRVTMTLTSLYCPAGEVILGGVKSAAEAVPGVREAHVELVWEPAWTPDRLSATAREQLGWDQTHVQP